MVVAKGKGTNESAKLAEVLFEEFATADDSVDILLTFHKLKAAIGAESVENGRELYALLKSKLQSWKCKSLWDVLDARAKHKEYGNQKICEDLQVLVIGAGPIGLRSAIEVALLGAKVIIVEKRTAFSRNNVLHLWPFLIHDFRSLGAKRFYGKFCSGSLDHIGIRMLQCMLMKAALILGVQIYTGVTFEKVIEPTSECGWRCEVNPPFHPASQLDIDMVIGADGKKNVLPDFPQIEMRGSLAIGITLNLVYHGTKQEAAIPEISGLAYHFKPQFFDELFQKTGVRLENFVYYKGETHYFVMTAVKSSLLARGALIMDYPKPAELLAPQNVNHQRLIEYALDAVKFGTEGKLTDIEFVKNDRGKSDIAVFDFTSLKKAEHAARIVERKGHRLLLALVGDSLIEPFWPTGSGCARGVLSALDTAWMLRSFAMDRPPLQVLSERENIYKLLSATTVDNLRKKFDAYTINPSSRYVDLNLKRVKEVYHLYDSDDPVNADFRVGRPSSVSSILENTKRRISVTNNNRTRKNRKKSSSDDLDDMEARNRTRKSSSDDLGKKKAIKSGKKSIKQALSRSQSRDTDSDLNDVTSNVKSKNKTKNKKLRNQSSESADEKEVRGQGQRKLGRAKLRDSDGSNNSLDTITESPKSAPKKKENAENKQNSVLMKQRSTTRWKLFGGNKPKVHSIDKGSKSDSNENLAEKTGDAKKGNAKKGNKKKGDEKKVKKELEKQPMKKGKVGLKENEVMTPNQAKTDVPEKLVGTQIPDLQMKRKVTENWAQKGSTQTNDHPKHGLLRSTSKNAAPFSDLKERAGVRPVSETFTRSSQRQLNSEQSSPKPLRNSLRKPSELRATQNIGFTRSISSGTATLPRTGQVKRTSSDIKTTDRVFDSLRRPRENKLSEEKKEPKQNERKEETGAEKENKRVKLDTKAGKVSVSVLDDIKSLSPAAQRIEPLLKTLTPDKKDLKYDDGGAITAAAGLAAMLALTTPLAMEGRQTELTDFQIERKKILANSPVSVREKIALLDSGSSPFTKTRRGLTSALDGTDGSPAPVKRPFSFSAARRTFKQELEDSGKSLTLPRKVFPRQSLHEKVFSGNADIPSALDSAINILIKSYSFSELQGTLKLMLNTFRCISKDPDDETPRRISIEGKLFFSRVWSVNEAKLFMVVSGWMEIGHFVIFPKTKTAHEPIRVLMQNYRQLWEKQALDTSCPQFTPRDSALKHRCRTNDDVFGENIELAGNYKRDSGGSHSGSDSGMGFSETASEQNIHAVIPIDDDVVSDVAANVITDDITIKRSSQVLDPRMYLEASYTQDDHDRKLNPSDYLSQSTVNPEQSTVIMSIPESPVESQIKPSHDYNPTKPSTSSSHRSKQSTFKDQPSNSLKDHHWEVLEETTPIPESPQGIQYGPALKSQLSQADEKRSTFRKSKQLASVAPVEEFMDDDPVLPQQDPAIPRHSNSDEREYKLSDSEVSTKDESKKQRTKSKRKNELDDLFQTLDFVSEALAPLRIVYEDKTTVSERKCKKSRRMAKSTAASRRREEYTRSKIQSNSTEEQTIGTKRGTRSQATTERQLNRGASRGNNDQHGEGIDQEAIARDQQAIAKDRKTRRARKQQTEDKEINITRSKHRRNNNTADQSTDEPVRRSRRIAESSNRKAMLVLDTSGYPEESSTDLNQAFVDSTLNETKQDTTMENDRSTGRKKKVRRQSSVVKTNKSRVRSKRTGYKSRRDRSMDA